MINNIIQRFSCFFCVTSHVFNRIQPTTNDEQYEMINQLKNIAILFILCVILILIKKRCLFVVPFLDVRNCITEHIFYQRE